MMFNQPCLTYVYFETSAYYGAPVKVEMRKCVRVDAESFDREVDLVLGNKVRPY